VRKAHNAEGNPSLRSGLMLDKRKNFDNSSKFLHPKRIKNKRGITIRWSFPSQGQFLFYDEIQSTLPLSR